MGVLDFLYDPITTKYFIEFFIAVVTTFLNFVTDDLHGWEYLYKTSHIQTGTVNWIVFTVYLSLFAPHYAVDTKKLTIFIFALIFFWLLSVGCAVVTTLGSRWKEHESISRIALTGSPLILAILSLAVFVFFDYFFWVISPNL
jgi:hypothetical protein